MSGTVKGIHRSCRLRDQIWKFSTIVLSVTVSLLSYRLATQGSQSGTPQLPQISVEWLPTGRYFLALEEPWVHAGPSTDLQTLHVRHSVQPAICILMIDSRPCDLDSYGAAKAQFPPDMAAVTPSLALHYALLHRYDYVRSRIPRDTERTAAWYDVPLLRTLLLDHKYGYVFKLDADSFFHQIERPIEPVIRQHGLDGEKAVWMPRDIQFGGFEFPDSNINAGVLLFARKPETQDMLDDWWRCPFDGTGDRGWTHNWPAEQGCLWAALVNSSRWAHACAPDWGSEFVGQRPSWVHHLTSGSSSGEDRDVQGAAEAVRYFLHAMRQSLLPAQVRLGYSRYAVVPR